MSGTLDRRRECDASISNKVRIRQAIRYDDQRERNSTAQKAIVYRGMK
jgi:hypothetical protein